MATTVAVDLGAQSGRVALARFDGERLGVTELHRFANEPVRVRGRLYWDVLALYRGVLEGLRAAAREAAVDSVSVDSWAVDFGLLDRRGQLVQNPVHYRDARRAAAFAGVLARVPARELYARTGIQLLPINSLFELAAMAAERDPALEHAAALLLVPDLFHYWLCGARAGELTNVTTTQCFDPVAGAWAQDLLERLDVPTSILPEIVPPGTPLAQLADEVDCETSLGGPRVVAGATHDTASAVVAVPFQREHAAFLSVGTWSLVGVERSAPVTDDAAFAANVTNEGGVAGTWRVLRNVTGLWLLHECRRAWAASGRALSFAELESLAAQAAPFRSLIDPDDPELAEPGDMPARIRAICERTGQPAPDEPGAVARCILESLALKHALVVGVLEDVVGATLDELHVVGGGARNELLCAWTAEAAARPVLAGPEEATLVGNALVQELALGGVSTLEQAREVVRASFPLRRYEPTAGGEWREARERFALLSDARAEREAAAREAAV